MLAIAIGGESRWGRIKARLATEAKPTPLQEKLDDMASLIGQIGTGAAIATFIAMLIIFLIDEKGALKNASKENLSSTRFRAASPISSSSPGASLSFPTPRRVLFSSSTAFIASASLSRTVDNYPVQSVCCQGALYQVP